MADVTTLFDLTQRRLWRFECTSCAHEVVVTPDGRTSDAGGGEDAPPPAEPTSCQAGTDGKLAVLMERFARGESLFDPRDSRDRIPTTIPREANHVREGLPGDLPRGVSWDAQRSKYRARATVDGERIYLGLFDTPALAAAAVGRAREGATEEITGAVVSDAG